VHALVTEQTGVLVIRVWVEGDPPPRLRSRITRTVDISERNQVTTAAASARQVEQVVRAWLEEFVAVTGAFAYDSSERKTPPPEND
jgi:hypothetical protein